MVQNPPYWRAHCALEHLKLRKLKLKCFVLDVQRRNLLSGMMVFVPCDRQLQRANKREGGVILTLI